MDDKARMFDLLPYMKFGVGILGDTPRGIVSIGDYEPIQEEKDADIQVVQEEIWGACGVSEDLLEGYKLIGVDLARDVADEARKVAVVGYGGNGHNLKEVILEMMRIEKMEVLVVDSLATMMEEKEKALELMDELLIDDCPKSLGLEGNRAERRGQKEQKTSYMSADVCPRGSRKTIKRKGHRR